MRGDVFGRLVELGLQLLLGDVGALFCGAQLAQRLNQLVGYRSGMFAEVCELLFEVSLQGLADGGANVRTVSMPPNDL